MTSKVPAGLMQHMISQHNFDMVHIMKDFSFYDKVKAVNYIRSKVLYLQCPTCGVAFANEDSLQEHLQCEGHSKLPTPALWCVSQFLRPVIPDDSLLCLLEDTPDGDLHPVPLECQVFGEDINVSPVSAEVARELSCDSSFDSTAVSCLFCRYTSLGKCGAVFAIFDL